LSRICSFDGRSRESRKLLSVLLWSRPFTTLPDFRGKSLLRGVRIHLYCNWESESTEWSCDAEVKYLTLHVSGNHFAKDEKIGHEYGLREYEDLYDNHLTPRRGYYEDGKLTVEFRISILHVSGVSGRALSDGNGRDFDGCQTGENRSIQAEHAQSGQALPLDLQESHGAEEAF
ncbi:hypothetical protein PFISCL1PPCAC_20942, partial [Pristionchus fissidentatus]